jgi:hypothetical protein
MAVKGHAEAEERDAPTRAGVAAGVGELLGHFFVGAMGLRLLAPIGDTATIRARRGAPQIAAGCEAPVWAAWTTNAGRLCACGSYDHAQSQHLRMHVLLIEWWLPSGGHHVGWWRCDRLRPLEWTVGRGS